MYEIKEVHLNSQHPGVIVERFHSHEDAMEWIIEKRDERKPGDPIVHGILPNGEGKKK